LGECRGEARRLEGRRRIALAKRSASAESCEECWALLGRHRGRIWYARRVGRTLGQPASVEFDGLWVLRREEQRLDVVGFYHTHPGGQPRPSARDVRTMRAWAGAFGKPLLCVIASPQGLAGYRFDDDRCCGVALAEIELFPRGIVIGVDTDGR